MTTKDHLPNKELDDKIWNLFLECDGTCERGQYEHWLFESGYKANKAKWTDEDMVKAMIRCTIDNWQSYSLLETKKWTENYLLSLNKQL